MLSCIALCYIAAGIGAVATTAAIPSWYTTILKPSFNPPNWIFGPVWSVLYTMMGVSLYLIAQSKHPNQKTAIILFMLQLVLNTLWSVLFFYFHLLLFAAIEILIFWAALVGFYVVAKPISRWAALLFIPYIAWVSFASLLSISIWWLNR